MKSKKVIMGMMLVAVLLTGVFSLTGCVSNETLAQRIEDKMLISEDGFFGYHVLEDKDGIKYAAWVRLTTEGQEEIKKTGKLYAMPTMGGYQLKQAGVVWWRSVESAGYYPLGMPEGEDLRIILPYPCIGGIGSSGGLSYPSGGDYNNSYNYKGMSVYYVFNYSNAPNRNYFVSDDLEDGELLGKLPYNPEREGYDFIGWARDAEGNQMLTDTDAKESVQITLFAQWTKK